MDLVTAVGFTILFFYCLTRILTFYGIEQSTYGIYLLFYIFIALCIVVFQKTEEIF